MKSMLVALFILLFPVLAFANDTDYYTKADHPGRHYDCMKPQDDGSLPVVAYENDRIIILCEGFGYKMQRPKNWRVLVDSVEWEWKGEWTSFIAKGPPDKVMTHEEVVSVIDATMKEPFYDSAEKRMVRWNGAMLAADLLTTAYGIKFGGCREANPIMAQAPVLGVGLAFWQFMDMRADAKKTPRFFTSSTMFDSWVPGAAHGAAALNNVIRCG